MKYRHYRNRLILIAAITIALLVIVLPLGTACDFGGESHSKARFTVKPAAGPAPLKVRFTDWSTGDITDWAWDFGDEVTSTEQNPSHTYDNAGTYMVTLTVSNSTSTDSVTRVEPVVVYATPVADFSVTPLSVIVAQEIEFADESTDATAWEWDFDNDGTVDSTEQNPSYSYGAPGEYTVTLTVTGPGGMHTKTRTYSVYPDGYTLTMAVDDTAHGSTSPVVGTHAYDEGEVVTITATAATGYKFANWSGAASGTAATTSVAMTSDKTATANFTELEEFTLTMAVSGDGVTDPAAGMHSVFEGTVVEITATPQSGWYFINWSGAASGTAATTNVAMSGDKMVTAKFSELPPANYTLTMAVSGNGGTDPAVGAHSILEGTTVDITATPAAGWKFVSWTGNVTDPYVAITTLVIDGDQTVTANFAELEVYTLTMAVSPSGSGTTSPAVGSPTYYEGDVVTITAAAATGYKFVNWSGGASGTTTTTSVAMTGDKTVTANFTQLEVYTLTMAVSPSGSGTTSPAVGSPTYYEGDVVTITAAAATGYKFVNWSGGASGTTTTTSVAMTGDKTVTANFTQLEVYTLTMAVIGDGETNPAVGTHSIVEGYARSITATPVAGWKFDSWTGDVADPYSASTYVVADSNQTVTANFIELIYPVVGTEWVYNVTSGDKTTEWTVTVTGEERVDGVSCYITDFSYSEPLVSDMNGMNVTVTGVKMWMSQTTMDVVRQEATALLSGDLLTVYLFPVYTGSHGAPLFVGKAWSLEETATLTTPATPLFTQTSDVEVAAQEYVTVPAGIFNCYRIEHSVDGQVEWTEWWCADVRGTVKIVKETIDGVQTAELKSYTPG
ncbi:PKD domain-containing protein [Chloroflexota bacterium]